MLLQPLFDVFMVDPSSAVLVVDDNSDVLRALQMLLSEYVGTVLTTTSPASIPALLQQTRCDVVLLDMNFRRHTVEGQEGFTLLERIHQIDPHLAVIMITAYGDIDQAVRALKMGASDFILKPWDNDRLVGSVQAAIRVSRSLRATAPHLERAHAKGDPPMQSMLGHSPVMQKVLALATKVAQTEADVLILGESGTGKELLAHALHCRSARAAEPFVGVDLGALTESLFESELFGHTRGAFTGANRQRTGRFELADKGTLFLDEIGNIPLTLQVKLLTVLERREVTPVGADRPIPIDIRLVCATNKSLPALVAAGQFREDLLYRINTVEIHLPPLRERNEDIPLLAEHFLHLYARKYDKPIERMSADFVAILQQYTWPGNVRELRHTLERAVILADGLVLEPDTLSLPRLREEASDEESGAIRTPVEETLRNLTLSELEQAVIRRALSKHGGNITRAAAELGLTRTALYRRIEKYGL
jgi:DNA-binding NtrC family response regulator